MFGSCKKWQVRIEGTSAIWVGLSSSLRLRRLLNVKYSDEVMMDGRDSRSKLNKPEKEEDRSGGHRPHVPHLVTLKHFDFINSLFQNNYFHAKSLNSALKRNEYSVLRLSFFLASVMHLFFVCPPDCVKNAPVFIFQQALCCLKLTHRRETHNWDVSFSDRYQ